jgi:hypothetical protein
MNGAELWFEDAAAGKRPTLCQLNGRYTDAASCCSDEHPFTYRKSRLYSGMIYYTLWDTPAFNPARPTKASYDVGQVMCIPNAMGRILA